MNYLDLIIEAWEDATNGTPAGETPGYFLRMLSSPAGEMRIGERVPFAIDRRQLRDQLQLLERRALDRAGMIALGRQLAGWLLPAGGSAGAPGVRELFLRSLAKAGPDTGLRLRLRLPPALAELPWEYIYLDQPGGGEGMDGFLALNPRIAIVRHEALPQEVPAIQPGTSQALKIVAALAAPPDMPRLDLAQERRDLEQALQGQAALRPVFIEQATLDQLLAAIPGAGVFHFAGHGEFALEMGERPRTYIGSGTLALADRRVSAEELAMNLQGNGVRLAVLAGCETGRRGGINVWGGIAPTLIKCAIPAVVANQFSISDTCAIAFSRHFYQALAGGLPIERAVAAGRLAAYNADPAGRDWGVAVLYMRAADGTLFAGAGSAAQRDQARSATEQAIERWLERVGAGDRVFGDTIGGDKIGGDTITIGDIRDSSGIAIGRGASAAIGEATPFATLFHELRTQIDALPEDPAADRAELHAFVQRIEHELANGPAANPSKIERWLSSLAEIAPPLARTLARALRSAPAPLSAEIQRIAAQFG